MITDEHKEKLITQWDACNSKTKMQIAATFLKEMKSGKQKQNRWTYLEENLPKSPLAKVR